MATKLTLGEWLHQLAHQYEDRPAVTEVASDKMMTYLELEQFTNRIAHGFKTLPHASTSYVGIMHENSLSYLAMTLCLEKNWHLLRCLLTAPFAGLLYLA